MDSSSVDLLGLDCFETTKAQNERNNIIFSHSEPSTQLVTQKCETEDILKPSNHNHSWPECSDNGSEDIRRTRKHRRVSTSLLEEATGPLNPHASILDDRTFAPPPLLPTISPVRFEFMAERAADMSSLPQFEKVMHSGKLLSRISIKSLIMKNWKDTFWIIYGVSQLIIFRCLSDYEEWLLNPYLSEDQRLSFIKLKIDFEKDLSVTGNRGYHCTKLLPKFYRNSGRLHQFKIDCMTTNGLSLVGAFGSRDKNEIMKLHTLFKEMMKKSPLNSSLLKLSNRSIDTRQSMKYKAPSFALSPENRRKKSHNPASSRRLTGNF